MIDRLYTQYQYIRAFLWIIIVYDLQYKLASIFGGGHGTRTRGADALLDFQSSSLATRSILHKIKLFNEKDFNYHSVYLVIHQKIHLLSLVNHQFFHK